MGRNNNQSALLRQWELLKLIPSRGEGMTVSEITQTLNQEGYQINKRQVERDLNQLLEAFPLDKNDDTIPHRWKWIKGASVDLPGMTMTEALSLHLIEDALEKLLPVSVLAVLSSRFKQAKKELSAIGKDNPKANWSNKIRTVPTSLPLMPPTFSKKTLEVIQEALISNEQIDVAYRDRHKNNHQYRFHPLALVNQGHVTYLIAAIDGQSEIRNFPLHRVNNVERLANFPVHHGDFDLDRYIQTGKMQFGNGGQIQLSAWVCPVLSNILEETPISTDQQLSVVNERTLLTATVINSWQLSNWILSHGDHIEVITPETLRHDITCRLSAALAAYDQ